MIEDKEREPSSSGGDSHQARAVYNAFKRGVWNQRQLIASLVAVFYLYFLVYGDMVPTLPSLNLVSNKNSRARHAASRGGKGGKGPKFVAKSEEEGLILADFGRRKKRVKEVCEKYGAFTTREKVLAKSKLDNSKRNSSTSTKGIETDLETWALLKKGSHHQFFLEKSNELLWCKVPKAASTSWLYAFLKMANVQEHELPEDNGMGLHAMLRDKYPLLAKNLYKKFIPSALKFVIVRHPFERLMSAYMDKLDNYLRDLRFRGGYYHAMYGGDIVSRYREMYQAKFPKHPLFMRKEPSFVEFIHYVIETPVSEFDEHWRPMYLLCPPCHFNFDIIIKMDTFTRDSEYILRQKDLDGFIKLEKKHSSIKQKKSEENLDPKQFLFSQLSKKMLRDLYNKYRVDCEMFEYSIEDYISFASDSAGFMPDIMPV